MIKEKGEKERRLLKKDTGGICRGSASLGEVVPANQLLFAICHLHPRVCQSVFSKQRIAKATERVGKEGKLEEMRN